MPLARTLIVSLCAIVLSGSSNVSLAQSIHDDFDDGVIDTSLWTTAGTAAGASVTESGSTLKLQQRGMLISVAAIPDLDVRGRFRFSGNPDDRFVVFTRSSGTFLSNPYNDLDNGIAFIYQPPIQHIEIGAYSYPSVSTQLASGTATLPLNTWIDFRVRDDGLNLELYIHDLNVPALTASSPLSFGQRLAFDNKWDPGCQVEIDWVDAHRVWKQNPSNLHWYLGTENLSWPAAEARATSMGGHLATIRNAAENTWLMDKFGPGAPNYGLWIGLNDRAQEGNFVWTSGDPVTYFNWDNSEPNDANGAEDCVQLVKGGGGVSGTWGRWNDEPESIARPAILEVISSDCDGNRIPDVTELISNPAADINGNGILDACECAVHNACVSDPNSTGFAARISLAGVSSISLDSFTLVCTGCPASGPGMFYYGTQPTQIPFGNGYRCVSGAIERTPITLASAGGVAARTLSLSTPPHSLNLLVGSIRYFQYWFRDVPAGGSMFDLSDSLVVQFCP